MRRRGSAAAANNIDEPFFGIFADLFRHLFRRFVVLSKSVWQSGIWIRRNAKIRIMGKRLQIIRTFYQNALIAGTTDSGKETECCFALPILP